MASRNERPRHVTEVMEGTFHGMESYGTEPFADAQITVFPLFGPRHACLFSSIQCYSRHYYTRFSIESGRT